MTGGEETKVLDSLWALNYAVTREGIYFMAPSEYGQAIRFLDLRTGEATSILSLKGSISTGMSVSPDGRYLLYSMGEPTASDLMLAEKFR